MNGEALKRALPVVLFGAGYALLLFLVFAPGGMSVDSFAQWDEAKTLTFNNWHPPAGALLFRLAMLVGAESPWPVLLLQTFALATAEFAVIRRVTGARPVVVAGLTAVAVLAPPVLLQAHVMWKDTWSAIAFIWCTWAAIALAQGTRTRWTYGTLVFSGFLTAAFRHNGLVLVFVLTGALAIWALVQKIRPVLLAAVASCAVALVGPKVVDVATRAYDMHPSVQIYAHDIAGVEKCTKFADWDRVGIEKVASREVFERGYSVNEVVPLFYSPVEKRPTLELFGAGQHLDEFKAAWWRAVSANPVCYLEHRWNVYKRMVALDHGPVCYPFHSTIEKNSFGVKSMSALPKMKALVVEVGNALGNTILFRLSWYTLAAAVLLGLFLYRREYILAATIAATLAYQLAYLFAATTCDFRMGWVLATVVWMTLPVAFVLAYRASKEAERSG